MKLLAEGQQTRIIIVIRLLSIGIKNVQKYKITLKT